MIVVWSSDVFASAVWKGCIHLSSCRSMAHGDETPMPTKARYNSNPWNRSAPYSLGGAAPTPDIVSKDTPNPSLICHPKDVPQSQQLPVAIEYRPSCLDVAFIPAGRKRRTFDNPQVAKEAPSAPSSRLATSKQVTKIVQTEMWTSYDLSA